ncbi:hypothetical protein CEXT_459531 [Caerostris extrusa]|uniref:Uncharacterized protein n=1 Tax=Caerostris extrusa TaxID=172846 RepID=A0AAV4PWW8_CAEEX|nr:hypothetical protein CEXT_459531 [Caerostris extrusa]
MDRFQIGSEDIYPNDSCLSSAYWEAILPLYLVTSDAKQGPYKRPVWDEPSPHQLVQCGFLVWLNLDSRLYCWYALLGCTLRATPHFTHPNTLLPFSSLFSYNPPYGKFFHPSHSYVRRSPCPYYSYYRPE